MGGKTFVHCRKTCQYRPEAEEKKDVHVYRNKARNLQLKQKIMPSLFKQEQEEEGGGEGEPTTESKSAKVKKERRENMFLTVPVYYTLYRYTIVLSQSTVVRTVRYALSQFRCGDPENFCCFPVHRIL
jgi:hypothetical protein